MAVTDQMVAYYKMDGNGNDSVWSNNLSASNMTWSTGQFWNCWVFNWSSSNCTLSDPSARMLDYNTWSISFWIKTSVTTYKPVMARNDNLTDQRYIATSWSTSGRLATYNWSAVIQSSVWVCDNNRHFCTITSSSWGIKFYIDGVAAGTWSGNMYLRATSTAPLLIWMRMYDSYFNWSLDEICFHSREITLAEHTVLMWSTYPFSSWPTPNTRNFFNLT